MMAQLILMDEKIFLLNFPQQILTLILESTNNSQYLKLIKAFEIYFAFMGSQESYEFQPKSSALSRLTRILNLQIVANQSLTTSMIHQKYASSLSKIQNGPIDRSASPFAPLLAQQTWYNTVLINPVMALTAYQCLFNQEKSPHQNLRLILVQKQATIQIEIEEAIRIRNGGFALLILKKPFWRAGWAGISHILNYKQLAHTCKVISHPEKSKKQEESHMIIQKVEKIKKNPVVLGESPPKIANKCDIGAPFCQIISEKPYVVGIQTNTQQITLFENQDVEQIEKKAQIYLKKNGNLQRILKQINIAQYQMYTMW